MDRESLGTACLIFTATLLIFLASPISQVGDSKYSMLVSYSVLKKGSFALDGYGLPRPGQVHQAGLVPHNQIYQLEVVNGRLLYYFPPGSSILSIPFVAVLDFAGISPVNSDGTYNRVGEILIQLGIANLLMAALASILYLTSRLVLPAWWSVVAALSGVLGTQIWSTASRGLWSHTWGIFLLGFVVLMLVAQEKRDPPSLNPVLLATLLTWTYLVRPTNSVSILTTTLYILLFHRRLFVRYGVTGAAWFAAFITYSRHYYGQMLPNYYHGSSLGFGSFWTAFAGNLISPSRGLFVFVPIIIFVAYLLARYWRKLPFPRLGVLALATAGGHLALVSGVRGWWGGHSYGPRYSTDLVPWFVLLGIMGIRAMLDSRDDKPESQIASFGLRTELKVGAALLLLSVLINGHGAFSHAARMWNVVPIDVDQQPARVWDWRQPQFLAGILPLRSQ